MEKLKRNEEIIINGDTKGSKHQISCLYLMGIFMSDNMISDNILGISAQYQVSML